MSIWIVTTGNSDIQLNTADNWEELYEEVRNTPPLADCDQFIAIDRDKKSNLFSVPARVLGLVYKNNLDNYYEDLKFPLLDTFQGYFKDKGIDYPKKIVVLLTDQSKIFTEDKIIDERCPYWQDTCTLEPIFKKYFDNNFEVELLFLCLKPESGQGLDHWNETLRLVETALDDNRLTLDYSSDETVYVSHQAGTPAISSAVQFGSLGRSKNVQFLVSNQYYDNSYTQQAKAESINSSYYWRGLQIQKVKKLIKDGLPGAALKLLKEVENIDKKHITKLEYFVKLFNIRSCIHKGQEFNVKLVTQRIIEAIDLIEIFLKQENYIQGITLLAAAQETFLKTAILSQVQRIKATQLVQWDKRGLFMKSEGILSKEDDFNTILLQIKFLIPQNGERDFESWQKYRNGQHTTFNLNNTKMIQWLIELKKDCKVWLLLEWSCQHRKNSEDDQRNQLMHNLVGVEKPKVIEYLLGYNQDSMKAFSATTKADGDEVVEAYRQYVKKPFKKALKLFGLWSEDGIENQLERELQVLADSIH